jgi:hypothetical protein
MSLGFIILRHVNCEKTNNYWIESYNCIRRFYPDNKILIIDDNSNYEYISDMELTNTTIINSEYKGRGELLPYIYYLQYKLFDKAVIIHDSVFIQNYVNFDVNYNFLWDFEHWYDIPEDEKNLISKLDNHEGLLEFYDQKHLWKGCFGCMSVISYDLLESINKKYNISILLQYVVSRSERHRLERVIAALISYENLEYQNNNSIFGNIHNYQQWAYTYENYLLNVHNYKNTKPIVKVFTGR